MHVWSFRLASFLAALSLVLLATNVAFAAQSARLELSEFKFTPGAATFAAGDAVTFTLVNTGRFPHNLTVQDLNGQTTTIASANVAAGQTATGTYTFAAPGTYTFWCPVGQHRANGMQGTFTVLAQGSPLPRSGGLPLDVVGGTLAGMAGLSFVSGLLLKRRA